MRIYLKNNRAEFHPEPYSFLKNVARRKRRPKRLQWLRDQFLIQVYIVT